MFTGSPEMLLLSCRQEAESAVRLTTAVAECVCNHQEEEIPQRDLKSSEFDHLTMNHVGWSSLSAGSYQHTVRNENLWFRLLDFSV